jgi:hypothetical protein
MPTVSDLIDYLQQFEPDTLVFRSEADVSEPCEFITLDSIPLESWQPNLEK